ncbi:hypothetical protein MP638_000164 [Amoeboaphelidium occidentale]|nr:hypothetical protein MP638_000164 [Amoeboaphelidium occidentale]
MGNLCAKAKDEEVEIPPMPVQHGTMILEQAVPQVTVEMKVIQPSSRTHLSNINNNTLEIPEDAEARSIVTNGSNVSLQMEDMENVVLDGSSSDETSTPQSPVRKGKTTDYAFMKQTEKLERLVSQLDFRKVQPQSGDLHARKDSLESMRSNRSHDTAGMNTAEDMIPDQDEDSDSEYELSQENNPFTDITLIDEDLSIEINSPKQPITVKTVQEGRVKSFADTLKQSTSQVSVGSHQD